MADTKHHMLGSGLMRQAQLLSGFTASLTQPLGSVYTAALPGGVVNGRQGSFFAWMKRSGNEQANANVIRPEGDPNGFAIQIGTTGGMSIQGRNTGGTLIMLVSTAANTLPIGTWTAVMAGWDLTDTAFCFLQPVGGTAVDETVLGTFLNQDIDYTVDTTVEVYGESSTDTSQMRDTEFCQVWMSTSQYIDFSVAANREGFVTSDGRPKNLGADGGLPTGTVPDFYMPQGNPNSISGSLAAVSNNAAVTKVAGPATEV